MGLGKLIYDSAKNRVPMEYSEYSVEDREQAIREKLFEVLEISQYEKKSFRKAMRKHRVEVFEIIEEIIDNVLANGDYQKNAFYNQFVEVRNLALGDENLFYIEGEKKLAVDTDGLLKAEGSGDAKFVVTEIKDSHVANYLMYDEEGAYLAPKPYKMITLEVIA